MDFGLCIVTTRDPNDVLYAFTQAEQQGFTFAGLFDSPYNFQDIYPHLGIAAVNTKTVELGPVRHQSTHSSSNCNRQCGRHARYSLAGSRFPRARPWRQRRQDARLEAREMEGLRAVDHRHARLDARPAGGGRRCAGAGTVDMG